MHQLNRFFRAIVDHLSYLVGSFLATVTSALRTPLRAVSERVPCVIVS
jgi:hypothetical protein